MEQDEKVEATQTSAEQKGSEPSQEKDPVQAELDRVEAKPKRTRLETLAYNASKWKNELAEERKKQGLSEEDDQPITRADLKAIQQEQAQETALTMADAEIENENERKLTKYHLENTIKPSGDAKTDLRIARLIVNAVKNGQIVEETLRTVAPKKAGSAASAPPKETIKAELTPQERMIQAGFKLTEQQVLDARPKE